ncbi:MAG: hypothetical protein CMI18_10565 [Opitutaceae bacterium]|nr:hypothetical protein [Opitutaceae bacterium]
MIKIRILNDEALPISIQTLLDYGEGTYKVAGINHMAFFLEYNYKGQAAHSLLFKALEGPAIVAQTRCVS